MKIKQILYNLLIFTVITYSVSGMPTNEISISNQNLYDQIKDYKSKSKISDQISYLQQIISENQSKNISNDTKIAFRNATTNIWTQVWALRNQPDFNKIQPLFKQMSDFFRSLLKIKILFSTNNLKIGLISK